jgi:hypothetical protein
MLVPSHSSTCVPYACRATQTELADITTVEPQLDDVTSLQVRCSRGAAIETVSGVARGCECNTATATPMATGIVTRTLG